MKKIGLLLFVFIVQMASAQESLVGSWKIDHIIGYKNSWEAGENENEYMITPPRLMKENMEMFDYGNWVVFKDNQTFTSYYTAPCGNDCFPSSYGRYELLEDDQIKIWVDSIFVRGFCKEKELHPKKELGVFVIEKSNGGFHLIKKK